MEHECEIIGSVVDRLYSLAERGDIVELTKEELQFMARHLELSPSAFYEEQYNSYCDMINPYLCDNEITERSLCNSVYESLEYLIEFWVANRENPNVDHKL